MDVCENLNAQEPEYVTGKNRLAEVGSHGQP